MLLMENVFEKNKNERRTCNPMYKSHDFRKQIDAKHLNRFPEREKYEHGNRCRNCRSYIGDLLVKN